MSDPEAYQMDDADDALFEDDLDDILLTGVADSINIQPPPHPTVINWLSTN